MAGRIIGDMGALIASLEQAGGRAVKAVNDAMEAEMIKVRDQAKIRVPREHSNMENAIKIENGGLRKSWIVYVDESMPDDTGKYTVGDYLNFLHEGHWRNLGKASLEKAEQTGVTPGPKFLENPFREAVQSGVVDRLQIALEQALADRGGR